MDKVSLQCVYLGTSENIVIELVNSVQTVNNFSNLFIYKAAELYPPIYDGRQHSASSDPSGRVVSLVVIIMQ